MNEIPIYKPPLSSGISQLCLVTPDGQMMNCHFFAIRAGSLVPENGSSFRQEVNGHSRNRFIGGTYQIPTKYGLIWYSTSILGSWRSPIE
jgi:hypothetical protein